MFGVPLEHLSREELIACLVMQVLENRDSIVEHRRQLKFISGGLVIRFIDIRGQGTGCRFAFWDTVTDSFVSVDGDYAWTSWGEFAEFFDTFADALGRYRSLCPDWVIDDGEDDIDEFYMREHTEVIECLNSTPSKIG